MPNSISQSSKDSGFQQAYSITVPDMKRHASNDEFNIMVLQALEAISISQTHKKDDKESSDDTTPFDTHGKLWLQVYADTCPINQDLSCVSKAKENKETALPVTTALAE